jgi:LmbE family N-acetylglucosaminyl deacetylase
MNVLAVDANPDDVEILCAGTLPVHAARGDRIAISSLITVDKGSTTAPPA